MQQRTFYDTSVSEVGIGCWQFGGDWGNISEESAISTLQAAHDNGVTFFDTADVYGGGHSERVIGRFLRETKASVFVATKLGRRGDPGWPDNFTLETMRRHTEDSLAHLGVDVLDLTQLHCIPTEQMRSGEVFEHLRTLRSEGKIKRFGASVETVEEGFLCLEQEGIASLQVIFNLFRQKPAEKLWDAAQKRNVAIIVRLPLASGLLTGKFHRDTTFAPQDHRTYNRDGQAFNVGETFAGLPFEKGVELADALKAYTPEGWTLTQMALRWCLDFEAVRVIIPGAKNPEQATANAAISALPPLPSELHTALRAYYDTEVAPFIRGPY